MWGRSIVGVVARIKKNVIDYIVLPLARKMPIVMIKLGKNDQALGATLL